MQIFECMCSNFSLFWVYSIVSNVWRSESYFVVVVVFALISVVLFLFGSAHQCDAMRWEWNVVMNFPATAVAVCHCTVQCRHRFSRFSFISHSTKIICVVLCRFYGIVFIVLYCTVLCAFDHFVFHKIQNEHCRMLTVKQCT